MHNKAHRLVRFFFIKRKNMLKIYVVLAACAVVVGTYYYGATIMRAKCRTQNAVNETQNIQTIITTNREINEQVFNTGLADIRNILRTKYTIAD